MKAYSVARKVGLTYNGRNTIDMKEIVKERACKISTRCDATCISSGGTPVNGISEAVTIYVRVSTYRVTLLFPLFYRLK